MKTRRVVLAAAVASSWVAAAEAQDTAPRLEQVGIQVCLFGNDVTIVTYNMATRDQYVGLGEWSGSTFNWTAGGFVLFKDNDFLQVADENSILIREGQLRQGICIPAGQQINQALTDAVGSDISTQMAGQAETLSQGLAAAHARIRELEEQINSMPSALELVDLHRCVDETSVALPEAIRAVNTGYLHLVGELGMMTRQDLTEALDAMREACGAS